jgi:FkbM family methyltransferase
VNGLVQRFINKPVHIVACALGERTGNAKMFQCDVNTIASLSQEWTRHRFSGYEWKSGEIVHVDTFDNMIKKFGEPRFAKIDTEGYEVCVLEGLSVPIHGICLEYTMEIIEDLYRCIDKLESLGNYEYSYTTGDYPSFKCVWTDRENMLDQLKTQFDENLWGNAYARRKT